MVITVTVTDHTGLTATESFQLNVTPVNDAPTLDVIATPQTTAEDTVKTVTLTVGDVDPSDVLTVTAVSSAPGVVKDAGLAVSGSGASRLLTITPEANASGASTITVTVTDNATTPASAQRQFVLNVTAVNDAPTIVSPGNRTVNEDTTGGPYAVTIGDVETAATALTLTRSSSNPTLLPLTGITLGGSGTNRTVTIAPASNQSGTATVTLTVSDGVVQTSTTFDVTVTAVDDPPTLTGADDDGVDRRGRHVHAQLHRGRCRYAARLDHGIRIVDQLGARPRLGDGRDRNRWDQDAHGQPGSERVRDDNDRGYRRGPHRQFCAQAVHAERDRRERCADDLRPRWRRSTSSSTEAPRPFRSRSVTSTTNASSLNILVESSDTALVKPGGLALGGSGTNRTLTMTPELNRTGASTIWVTVKDAIGASVVDSFPLTVNDVACSFNPNVSVQALLARGRRRRRADGRFAGRDQKGTGCAWTVASSAEWLTVESPERGFGDGALHYEVAPNSGVSSRTAVLTIAGQTFTMTQAGAPVSLRLHAGVEDGSGSRRGLHARGYRQRQWVPVVQRLGGRELALRDGRVADRASRCSSPRTRTRRHEPAPCGCPGAPASRRRPSPRPLPEPARTSWRRT